MCLSEKKNLLVRHADCGRDYGNARVPRFFFLSIQEGNIPKPLRIIRLVLCDGVWPIECGRK